MVRSSQKQSSRSIWSSSLSFFFLIERKKISPNYLGRYIRLLLSTFSLMPAAVRTRKPMWDSALKKLGWATPKSPRGKVLLWRTRGSPPCHLLHTFKNPCASGQVLQFQVGANSPFQIHPKATLDMWLDCNLPVRFPKQLSRGKTLTHPDWNLCMLTEGSYISNGTGRYFEMVWKPGHYSGGKINGKLFTSEFWE